MSKERPILFNDEMVRAILEGRKSQTRRIVKPAPPANLDKALHVGVGSFEAVRASGLFRFSENQTGDMWPEGPMPCPYGRPGDRLWVQEVHGYKIRSVGGTPHEQVTYRATDPDAAHCYDCNGNELPMLWQEPEKMPRWASRITLEITDVRVERLQDISEADSENEGCAPAFLDEFGNVGGAPFYRRGFCKLWREIYGHDSWGENPWVWVISFKRVEQEVKAA